jgi:dTDP-4-dehydrorhamnose 3,5-epimerase-like enzyme
MTFEAPRIISFPRIGSSALGFNSTVPFEVKRAFWTYYTPDSVLRGRHAHHNTEMVLVACAGRIIVNTEMPDGRIDIFTLEKPEVGLYMPKYCWHTMQYSHSSVQLVLASSFYDEQDYIRSYEEFKQLQLPAKS